VILYSPWQTSVYLSSDMMITEVLPWSRKWD